MIVLAVEVAEGRLVPLAPEQEDIDFQGEVYDLSGTYHRLGVSAHLYM